MPPLAPFCLCQWSLLWHDFKRTGNDLLSSYPTTNERGERVLPDYDDGSSFHLHRGVSRRWGLILAGKFLQYQYPHLSRYYAGVFKGLGGILRSFRAFRRVSEASASRRHFQGLRRVSCSLNKVRAGFRGISEALKEVSEQLQRVSNSLRRRFREFRKVLVALHLVRGSFWGISEAFQEVSE